MNWITQFLTWLRLLFAGWINPPYKTIVVQALLPEKLKRKTIYIVEEDGFEEQAAMLCPRCRDHVLHMNLLPDERPCWTITCHDDGTASLHPSVWRKKDCGVHFWFKRGRVRWT